MAKEATLEIGVPDVEVDETSTTIDAPVRLGPVSARFRVELPCWAKAPPRVGDALLLWFLLPAMQRAERLHVDAEVSPELLERIGRAQEIWASLPRFTGLRLVGVEAPVAAATDDGEGRPWAAFFPGSVDAAFTALRHRERLAFLAFAHGLDREELGADERAATSTALRAAARALDLPLVEVDTNYWAVAVGALRCDPAGASTAAPYGLAHLLAPDVERLLVPGELSYREYRQAPEQTTHDPLLDPWVGSDAVTIRVDGMAWRRAEKRAALRERPELLAALRACEQQNPPDGGVDRPEAPRRVDFASADLRTAARDTLDRYSGRSELLRRTPWLLPALASSQLTGRGERKAFRNRLRRALGQKAKVPRPRKRQGFQPCPEPGASLFVPDPWIGRLPNGDWHYAFALWLRRRSGRDLLLQEVSL